MAPLPRPPPKPRPRPSPTSPSVIHPCPISWAGCSCCASTTKSRRCQRPSRCRPIRRRLQDRVHTPQLLALLLERLDQTACMTGLRRSELCGLQWPDIDLDSAVLSVKRARFEKNGRSNCRKGTRRGLGAMSASTSARRVQSVVKALGIFQMLLTSERPLPP